MWLPRSPSAWWRLAGRRQPSQPPRRLPRRPPLQSKRRPLRQPRPLWPRQRCPNNGPGRGQAGAWTEDDLAYATWNSITLTLDMHFPAEPVGAPIVFNPLDEKPLVDRGMIAVRIDDYDVGLVEEPPEEDDFGPGGFLFDRGARARALAEEVACAIRFARVRASELGSDDPIVALIGFSAGAGIGTHVALFGDALEDRWDEFAAAGGPPQQVECAVTDGSTHVDALVGMAGPYDLFVPAFDGFCGRAFQQEVDPELQQFLASAIGANPDLKVRLIHGTTDDIPVEYATEFVTLLTGAGYDAQLITFEGGHQLPPNELYLSTVMEVVGG